MNGRKLGIVMLVGVALGLGVGACSPATFGDVLGALGKIQSGQLSALTADEIKMINHGVASLDDGSNQSADCPPLIRLTGEQCAAMVQFFRENQVDSGEALVEITAQADQDPTTIKGVGELAKAFEGSGITLDVDHPGTPLFRQLFWLIFSGNETDPATGTEASP
jgi:hypothetical protein